MGSMTCDWCEERFESFLDDALSAGDRARLRLHVDGCENCRGLLEELRVVDALLLAPRAVELPANFTVATMADVHAMPLPQPRCAPITASLVAYVVAAWSLVAAALLIAPDAVLSAGKNVLAVGTTVLGAIAGLSHVLGHFGDRGDVTSWTTFAGGVVIADGIVLVAVVAALRAARPRIGERLRW
jgi:anti-sigma factor RsiW